MRQRTDRRLSEDCSLFNPRNGGLQRQTDVCATEIPYDPDPGRLRPRTRRFPTPQRVRPPPDGSTLAGTRYGCVHRPPGALGRRQHRFRPLRVPPRRADHGRKCPSGHDQPLRRRRRRVIRQDRSASGGPAQQVDTVAAVAFPATPSLRARRRRAACSQRWIAPNARRRENSIASLKDARILLSNRVTRAVSALDRLARNIVKSIS